jgi:hypothetical protein
MRCFCLAFLLAFLLAPIGSRAEEPAQPAPPDARCPVPADQQWTRQETFVWERVCIGETADFNEAPGYGGELDPRSDLPGSRVLRSSFIEAILVKDDYRRMLKRTGVQIVGARFSERLDLRGTSIEHSLAFR